jgi:hypothetical protein
VTAPEQAPTERRRSWLAHPAVRVLLVLVIVFLLIQLVPNRVQNHAVISEPRWDSAKTRELAVAACFDCHSNQTRSIWYEKVAPISWWIKGHVDEGRSALNFSECGTRREEDDLAESVIEGSMPPSYYTWFGLHSDAELNATERKALADGLTASAANGCQPAP